MTEAEHEPQPQEKIRAIIIDYDLGWDCEETLNRSGVEIVARFSDYYSKTKTGFLNMGKMDEFIESESFDAIVIHTDEQEGRVFVRKLKKVNPKVYVVSVSAGHKVRRYSDHHLISSIDFDYMGRVICEGVAKKRKEAGQKGDGVKESLLEKARKRDLR